jgi:hypothetical protein
MIDGTIGEKYIYGLSQNMWQNKTLLFRFAIQNGKLTPFDDAARTPSPTLLDDREIPTTSSLALGHGSLWACFPGRALQRINADTGEISESLPVGDLVAVADNAGQLYGLYADGRVAKLDNRAKPNVLFQRSGLKQPVRLSISPDRQRFAISDHGWNQVFITDLEGNDLHAIGQPIDGKDRPAGEFITTDVIQPMGSAFDRHGRLWITEGSKNCKRVTLWSDSFELLNQFWGQADYGAMAGFPITHDATRFIAHGIEFKLDPDPQPKVRKTNEQPLIYHPQLASTQRGLVYEVDGREYAVGTPGFNKPEDMRIFKRDDDGVFRACVIVMFTKGGNKTPSTAWVDRNGDGKQTDNEIVSDADIDSLYWSNGWVRPDLTFFSVNGHRYAPESFSAQGVPLYDFASPEPVANWIEVQNKQGATGTPIVDRQGNVSDGIRFHTVDGRRGSYPNRYGRHTAPAAQRGLLIAPFRTNGVVEDLPGIGSMTALGGDRGEWFLLSMDGLYVSSISQDIRGNTLPDETYIGGESFGGFIWRDRDTGRVLIQLGGPSYRIMELIGLDTGVRETISLNVTQEQIAEGAALAQSMQQSDEPEPEALKIAKVKRLPTEAPAVGADTSQPLIAGGVDLRVSEAGNAQRWFRASLAHDGKTLAVAYQVADDSPWQNAADQYTHAFIGGDAVDLQLDVPGRGPIRLLVANIAGKGTAVYSQRDAASSADAVTYVVANNPANATRLGLVKRLDSAEVQVKHGPVGYTVLITVPLEALGLDAAMGQTVRGIVGVIYSDPSGTNRAARLYWHHKATGMVNDVPTEARLSPDKWGPIRVEP